VKIALKGQGAGWVIDSIVNDYKKYSRHEIVRLNKNPDVFWCVNLFSFPSLIDSVPKGCVPIVHVHHISEDQLEAYNFKAFNRGYACIVYNKKVEKAALKYLSIPVHVLPYWVLSGTFKPKNEEVIFKLKQEIAQNDEMLIGSFVKDGNGQKGATPKTSKNPDMFIDILNKLRESIKIKVILTGYARQYMVNALTKLKIPFVYKERYGDIQTLYDCLDWYFVTSRYEGGPQSILEASYRKVNILSTDVGVASEILHPDCICSSVGDFVNRVEQKVNRTDYNYNNIIKNHMPTDIIPKWDDFFEDCYKRWSRE